ncbi:MAG: hypothetical protein AABW50_04595 [Nanoarchaeota archaeon]
MKKTTYLGNKKRGWIKIVESFAAILLIAGVFLVVLQKGYIAKEDPADKIYEAELAVLRGIQSNETLRQIVLAVPEPLPSNSSNFAEIKNKINYDIPNYLQCETLICEINGSCTFYLQSDKDVYARAVTISSTLNEYKPRQLKLFCWVK